MTLKYLAITAILFFKMRPKFFTSKTIAGQDFPWGILHSEALEPIVRQIIRTKKRSAKHAAWSQPAGELVPDSDKNPNTRDVNNSP